MCKSMESLIGDWYYSKESHNYKASEMILRGRDIYSFGTHYLSARKGDGYILLNTYGYSKRTSGQLSKIRSFLCRNSLMGYVLPFSSHREQCPPWWLAMERPPIGLVLSSLLLSSETPSSRELYVLAKAYREELGGTTLSDRATIPSGMWGGDIAKLREILGGGPGTDVATLHHIAVDEGVEAAYEWCYSTSGSRGRSGQEELATLLVDRYRSLEVQAGDLPGYKGRFWGKIMGVPKEDRPALAAELLISRPSLKPHAEAFLNAYNNAQHKRSSL